MNKNIKKTEAFDMCKVALQAIAICSIVPSFIYSLLAFSSLGHHLYAKALFLGGAVVIEFVKIVFLKLAVSRKDWTGAVKVFLISFGVLAMLTSLIFSYAFSVNENNAVRNAFISNSDEAKTANKAVTTREDMIKGYKNKITKLEAEKKSLVEAIQADIKTKPTNYITVRTNLQKDITKITTDYNTRISNKEDELTAQQEKLTEPTTATVETEKNIDVALGAVMTPEREKQFFAFIVVFIELCGISSTIIVSLPRLRIKKHVFTYEDETNNSTERQNDPDQNDYVKPENNIGMKRTPNPITAKKSEYDNNPYDMSYTGTEKPNKIGFAIDREVNNIESQSKSTTDTGKSVPPEEFIKGFASEKSMKQGINLKKSNSESLNSTDISVYVAKMQETKTLRKLGYESRGYQWIAKETGLKEETCRKIKGHLENIGIIKSDGIRTYIL